MKLFVLATLFICAPAMATEQMYLQAEASQSAGQLITITSHALILADGKKILYGSYSDEEGIKNYEPTKIANLVCDLSKPVGGTESTIFCIAAK